MITWNDVLTQARTGNLVPPSRVEKTDEEWKSVLSPEQFRVTRQQGTERAFSSQMCQLFEPGRYACVCCGTVLFDAGEKFDSGTGWPSFTQPLNPQVVAYHADNSHGMVRVEATCNLCDAHLGHVFPDGPPPTGLRYCINAVSLRKVHEDEEESTPVEETAEAPAELTASPQTAQATFGGGCFWCTEAIFQQLRGVTRVESGYSGGTVPDPTYEDVCTGRTGHAEVIEVTYNPSEIRFEDLLRVHLATHNPTTMNRQGADQGTQYRSAIFYRTQEEKEIASRVIGEVQRTLDKPIVTQLSPFERFYKAEESHQNYYNDHAQGQYCQVVILPKLQKLREQHGERLKTGTPTL